MLFSVETRQKLRIEGIVAMLHYDNDYLKILSL